MGFTSGFTGGVALTLSVAYLTARAHQRNREQQSLALRSQALAIQNLIDPIPEPLPPTRSEVAAAQRATAIEVAKDKWNREVETAVRWVQHTDWVEVREGIEDSASRLWAKTTGSSIEEAEKATKQEVSSIAQKAKRRAEETARAAATKATGAADEAGRKSEELAMSAENKALEARLRAKKEMKKAEGVVKEKGSEASSEAKGVLASALDKGRETAKGIVGLAKSTIGMAEDKLDIKSDGKLTPATDPVEKALHQRYEKPETRKPLTVAEALKQRYIPIDERDNTNLRGL